MVQKVLKVGSSAAVTIPKKSLEELGLKIGDRITVDIDKNRKIVSIKAAEKLSKEDAKIAKLALSFVNKYRKDLEALARK